jgi:hypothetical protein
VGNLPRHGTESTPLTSYALGDSARLLDVVVVADEIGETRGREMRLGACYKFRCRSVGVRSDTYFLNISSRCQVMFSLPAKMHSHVS